MPSFLLIFGQFISRVPQKIDALYHKFQYDSIGTSRTLISTQLYISVYLDRYNSRSLLAQIRFYEIKRARN